MIDKFTEQKIKEAASIVDVVGDFLELRRSGVNYETLCPFHNDRHLGSFVVSPRHNVYKCFSCDAKGGPVDFLIHYAHMDYPDALRYLAQKYGIWIDDDPRERQRFQNVRPAKPRSLADAIPPDLPPRLWPASWTGVYRDLSRDPLALWLDGQPWDDVARHRLEGVKADYMLSHAAFDWKGEHHEWTLFWQMDEAGRVHNGHLMKYRADGHRDKADDYSQTWLHARMKYATGANHFDDRVNRASYCLFGQHLLPRYPQARVNIVESEKTAIIMATAYGNHYHQVWLACCGMQNLNRERLAPLIEAGRRIVLFPDRDGIDRWREQASRIGYGAMEIDTTLVRRCWLPQDGEKADCGDVVLRLINESSNT